MYEVGAGKARFKVVGVLLVLAFLTGCGAKMVTPPAPQQIIVEKPDIGEINTVGLGETLLLKMNVYQFYGLELKERLTDSGSVREYVMEPHTLPYIDKLEDGR